MTCKFLNLSFKIKDKKIAKTPKYSTKQPKLKTNHTIGSDKKKK